MHIASPTDRSADLAHPLLVETGAESLLHLLDQVVRQLPDGLYLKQVKQTGDIVNVQGYATSNARVSH